MSWTDARSLDDLRFHNLMVFFSCLAVGLWAVKVVAQILKVKSLGLQLANRRALSLPGLSVFAWDLQEIIRQHFNQILRIRRTVPPVPIKRHALSVHIDPGSVTVNDNSVEFRVDALAPCRVRVFWGSTAAECKELMERVQSESGVDGISVPAGLDYECTVPHPVHPDLLQSFMDTPLIRSARSMVADTVVPLVIVAEASRMPVVSHVQDEPVLQMHGEVSLVRFRSASSNRATPEVFHQVAFGESATCEIEGIFGFEDEETDCVVCYDLPKNVILLPCHHCSVCHPCFTHLRDESCPLCRSPFSAFVTIPTCSGRAQEVTPLRSSRDATEPASPDSTPHHPRHRPERSEDGLSGSDTSQQSTARSLSGLSLQNMRTGSEQEASHDLEEGLCCDRGSPSEPSGSLLQGKLQSHRFWNEAPLLRPQAGQEVSLE